MKQVIQRKIMLSYWSCGASACKKFHKTEAAARLCQVQDSPTRAKYGPEGLSTRAMNVLVDGFNHIEGYAFDRTPASLSSLAPLQILNLPNCGSLTFREITAWMQNAGFWQAFNAQMQKAYDSFEGPAKFRPYFDLIGARQ